MQNSAFCIYGYEFIYSTRGPILLELFRFCLSVDAANGLQIHILQCLQNWNGIFVSINMSYPSGILQSQSVQNITQK